MYFRGEKGEIAKVSPLFSTHGEERQHQSPIPRAFLSLHSILKSQGRILIGCIGSGTHHSGEGT